MATVIPALQRRLSRFGGGGLMKRIATVKPTRCALLGVVMAISIVSISVGQEGRGLREPVFRVSAKNDPAAPAQPAHPLDPALDLARKGLETVQKNIDDYECILVKRERINGELMDQQFIYTKVRNHKEQDGRVVAPFSVYMHFLKPTDIKGREVIYVEGQNNGKLCAHEGGVKGRLLPTVWLHPESSLAMKGQRYPITEVGVENLITKLIERGEREKRFPNVEVSFKKNAKVNDRVCTVLEIRHPDQRPQYEFHLAQVFIDDELNVPIRYAAYGWPEKGDDLPVQEEYTYMKLKLNQGFTDKDFDTKNKEYNF